MSKTNSESRGVRESGELTNDELAPVVGGRNHQVNHLAEAKMDFQNGDIFGGLVHLAAAQGK